MCHSALPTLTRCCRVTRITSPSAISAARVARASPTASIGVCRSFTDATYSWRSRDRRPPRAWARSWLFDGLLLAAEQAHEPQQCRALILPDLIRYGSVVGARQHREVARLGNESERPEVRSINVWRRIVPGWRMYGHAYAHIECGVPLEGEPEASIIRRDDQRIGDRRPGRLRPVIDCGPEIRDEDVIDLAVAIDGRCSQGHVIARVGGQLGPLMREHERPPHHTDRGCGRLIQIFLGAIVARGSDTGRQGQNHPGKGASAGYPARSSGPRARHDRGVSDEPQETVHGQKL